MRNNWKNSRPRALLKAAYYFVMRLFMLIFGIFPIRPDKIVFKSHDGKCTNEPSLIFDRLKELPGADFVWVLKKGNTPPGQARAVRAKSLREAYELATAKAWIDNARKPFWVKKRRGQFYIQTWHGPVCLKAVEKDAEATLDRTYLRSAREDSEKTDLMVAETKWRKNNMKSAFWYDGEILEAEFKRSGKNPRESAAAVRRYFHLEEGTRLLLYAPTFRADGSVSCYAMDFHGVLNALAENGEKWKIIIRLHPNVADKVDFIGYSDDLLEGTRYPGIDDLLHASDIIVTDYSGILFDSYRLRKRVLLYAADIEEYRRADRPLYFDIEDLPSPLARSSGELINLIRNFNDAEYEEKRRRFVDGLGFFEDDAAEKCAELIRAALGKGERQ